jgi:hypothetical protein
MLVMRSRKISIIVFSLVVGVLIFAGQALALHIELIEITGTTTKIDAYNQWLNLPNNSRLIGPAYVLEDFESYKVGWYSELDTKGGTFTARGSAGTGATAFLTNNPVLPGHGPAAVDVNGNDLRFSIRNGETEWYGRENQTAEGEQYLDSSDVTEIHLDLTTVNCSWSNIFFYLQDPSDVRAITTGSADRLSKSVSSRPNGSLWFVGISKDVDDSLASISWSVTNQHDGYGLDDFLTVAEIPEPTTMFLFAAGLAVFACVARRRRLENKANSDC